MRNVQTLVVLQFFVKVIKPFGIPNQIKDKWEETKLSHCISLFKEDGALVLVLKRIHILPCKSFQSSQAIHIERLLE